MTQMCLKYCSQYLPMSAIISVRRCLKAYNVCNKTVLCFSLLLIFVRLFGYSVKKTFFVAFYVSVPIVRPAAVSSWNSPKKKTKQTKQNQTKNCDLDGAHRRQVVKKAMFLISVLCSKDEKVW